jgi:hypothetical protein
MATLSTTNPTMMDWAKTRDPDGSTSQIIEMLSQKNRMLDDMVIKEGNTPTGEQVTLRTGLATASFRELNQGTAATKSTTAQVTENAAILVSRSHVDEDIANLEDDLSAYRMSMARGHMQGMSNTQATTMVYGSAANPEEYVGFNNRYNSLTGDANSDNVLSAGGSGSDNMSILLVNWSTDGVYTFFPKGSDVGLTHQDLGLDDVDDASGNPFRAYKDLYKWKLGLAVADWRDAVRICNIDNSDLVNLTGTQAITASTAIHKQMAKALDHIPDISSGRPAFYVNRTVASNLRIAAMDTSNGAVTIEPAINQFGKNIHQLMYLGTPVRLMDALTIAEATVS